MFKTFKTIKKIYLVNNIRQNEKKKLDIKKKVIYYIMC